MSGTIILRKQKSLDVRTVDFACIANAIRARASTSPVAKKLLESIDDFGMNMISADELSSSEFSVFRDLMKDVQDGLKDDHGLTDFFDELFRLVAVDERLGAK
jgi:hypothetical protein